MPDNSSNLTKSIPFADGHATVTLNTNPALVAALATLQPFGPFANINDPIASVEAGGSTPDGVVKFQEGQATFTLKGDITTQLFATKTLAQAFDVLRVGDNDFPAQPAASPASGAGYVMFEAGADLSGTINGSLALGATGSVTFGADGALSRMFAVIYEVPAATNWDEALTGVFQRWLLPSQISAGTVPPAGTWIVSEVEGSLKGTLAATWGYDFNWTRQLKALNWKGDIGLRLQLGLQAQVQMSVSGKYIVVVGRPQNSSTIRMQLYKSPKLGWGFALNAGVTATGTTPSQQQINDLIDAVVGTNGAQVLHDLDRWTAPDADLTALFQGATVDYVNQFLKSVTNTTGKDGLVILRKYLDTWNNLPHAIATKVTSFVDREIDLAPLRQFLSDVQGVNSLQDMANLIVKYVGDPSLNTASPWLEWVEAAVGGPIAQAATDPYLSVVKDYATKTLAVLDGSQLQNVLVGLQDYIAKRLNVTKLLNADPQAAVDDWLKARIAAFMDLPAVKDSDIAQFVAQVRKLRGQFDNIYKKTIDALNKSYVFKLNYAYQRTTTDETLLDAEFDVNNSASLKVLHDVLHGDFSGLLSSDFGKSIGVKLNSGTFTHRVQRESHLELNFPNFDKEWTHLNDSVADVKIMDGRVYACDLSATDESKLTLNSRFERDSKVVLSGIWRIANQSGVTVHADPDGLSLVYSLWYVNPDTRSAPLQNQLQGLTTELLHRGPSELTQWLRALDRSADNLMDDRLGAIAFRFQSSVSGMVADGWSRSASNDIYQQLSVRLQTMLKQWVRFYYFRDLKKFQQQNISMVVLAYCSLPPIPAFTTDAGFPQARPGGGMYWDFAIQDLTDDTSAIMSLFKWSQFWINFANNLTWARNQVDATTAQLYVMQDPQKMLNDFILPHPSEVTTRPGPVIFADIVGWERDLVLKLCGSAQILGKLGDQMRTGKDVTTEQLRKALETVGEKISEGLQGDLHNDFTGDTLQPLGSLLFAAGSEVLTQGAAKPVTTQFLDLAQLKKGAALPQQDATWNSPDLLVHQTITAGI